MKLYNIEPIEKEFPWGKMKIVFIGEKGRGRIYALIPFHAEYDPGAQDYEIAQTRSGKPKIVRTGKPSEGYIARISTYGDYLRNDHGELRMLKANVPNVRIIATGLGAFGEAGRLGFWPDYLLTIKPPYPVIFHVLPTRLKDYWLVFLEKAVYKLYKEEFASFEETMGIVIPMGDDYDDIDKLLPKQ